MASDNHAHYSRIGFTVVVGIVAIAATLVYMGGFHDPNSEFIAETYSDTPVNGLSVGSPVNLFGIKVGEVREITLALATYGDYGATTNDFGRVSIVLAINKKRIGYGMVDNADLRDFIHDRTRKGLRATITQNGITGLSRVDLKVDDSAPPLELPTWTPRYVLIPPSPSLMDNFAVAATKLMNKLKTIDLDTAWSNVTRIVDSSARTAENVDAMVESQRAGVAAIVQNAEDVSLSMKVLSEKLNQNPSLLLRERDPQPLPETAR